MAQTNEMTERLIKWLKNHGAIQVVLKNGWGVMIWKYDEDKKEFLSQRGGYRWDASGKSINKSAKNDFDLTHKQNSYM